MSTSETMVLIGNYIMLFSILAEWILHIGGIPSKLQAIISGLAEITTGSNRICTVFSGQTALAPLLCTVAFGGLSGIFQTCAVIRNKTIAPDYDSSGISDTKNTNGCSRLQKEAGLNAQHYILWKLLHAFLTFCIFTLAQHFLLTRPL